MLTRIWLTYKQHRFETIALVSVCLGLTVAALIETYRISSLNVPMSCFNSWNGGYDPNQGPLDAATAHCNTLVESFNSLQRGVDMNLVTLLLLFAPLLVGIVFGAPLVAREIEQGTAPLSWALSGSRRRWLFGKMLAGMLLIIPLMLAVGFAADALEGARNPGLQVHAAFENYLGRGILDVFWALAAFAGTVALGTLLGRTLPALILALIVCFFVRVGAEAGVARVLLVPFAVRETPSAVMPQGGWYSGQVDLLSYWKAYLDGKPFDGDVNTWWMEHPNPPMVELTPDPNGSFFPGAQFGPGAGQGAQAGPVATPAPGASALPEDPNSPGQPTTIFVIDDSKVPQSIPFAIPGSWYWNVIAFVSGILLLGSLFLSAVAMVWVDRRRPY